jgi:hypothetical protein
MIFLTDELVVAKCAKKTHPNSDWRSQTTKKPFWLVKLPDYRKSVENKSQCVVNSFIFIPH